MKLQSKYVPVIYLLLGLWAYKNTFSVFIPGDDYSLFYLFKTEGLAGAIHNLGLYLFSLPFIFVLYKLIGDSSFAWVAASLLLHVINSYLVFVLAKKILSCVVQERNDLIAFFSGAAFLLSPYQTEAVLWTPTDVTILLSVLLSLLCILLLLNYFEDQRSAQLYGSWLFFVAAVFSYESSWIVPGLALLLFIFVRYNGKKPLTVKEFLLKISIPQGLILVSYFVLSKFLYGNWLWHAQHFGISSSFAQLAGCTMKYFARFFLFYRYLPLNAMDEFLREAYSHKSILLITGILLFMLSIVALAGIISRKNAKLRLLTFVFLCFLVSLLPVLSLDSSFLRNIYPDRYGYFPSVFFYVFAASCITLVLKKFSLPVLIGYVALCWILLAQTISVWTSASEYCNRLTESYRPFLKYDKVYVLNVPAYYKGVAAFRSAFAETIFMKYDCAADNIRVVSGCYQRSPADSVVSVSRTDSSVLVVGPRMKTPYFSSSGGWAVSYETDEYAVKYDLAGCAYTLRFKGEIPRNSAFVYCSGGIWKKAL